MRNYPVKKIIVFVLFLFAAFSLGPLMADPIRVKIAWTLSPLWKVTTRFKGLLGSKERGTSEQMRKLEAENFQLRRTLTRLTSDERVGKAVEARVMYRDPSSWSSTLWVDVGEATNQKMGQTIIAKRSPVLVGRSLVGIVDYVGAKQSRIRLLTDRKLHPSVRSVRGEMQHQAIIEHLEVIIPALSHNPEYAAFFNRIKERLDEEKTTHYLAKGFLQGTAAPLWRRVGSELTGIGFNYDFSDSLGETKRVNLNQPKALLQEGDLLVTTGMDGVFPADLFVAFVTKVYPLKEGDVSYKLEARPYISDLGSLQSCTIIPPLEFVFDEL